MEDAVILPADELSDLEIYAPNFKTGTHVFVCPTFGIGSTLTLVVNNRHPDVRARYENFTNIVAVSMRVAEKLRVDFTGDLVHIKPAEEEKK